MSCARFVFVLGIFKVFPVTTLADNGQGFTYKHLAAGYRVVELECQPKLDFPGNDILMIKIYNSTTMMKMAQVLGGKCPTIEDTSNAENLYLPSCTLSQDHSAISLKVLVTNYDDSIEQTFLCNVTKVDENNQVTSVVWTVQVGKPENTQTTETDYTGHQWLPDPAYKMLAGLEREVNILEPALIGTGVILCVILFSLAVQMFLSCKIIRYLEYRQAPRQYQLSNSQSKMTDHHKSGPLEEPFYATV